MKENIILMADTYKLSHQYPNVYPSNAINLHSYGEARVSPDTEIVMVGMQGFLKRYLQNPITEGDLQEAIEVSTLTGVPINETVWRKVLDKWGGYLPIRIYALPEGTVATGGQPLWAIELMDDDPELASLPSFVETMIQRAIWYPSTIASNDRVLWKRLKHLFEIASDKPELLGFSYHDFGARGVSSEESAMIGGFAHLVYFEGTDTLAALRYARQMYRVQDVPGYSVPATEHSIQCSFGATRYDQKAYILNTIERLGKPGGIVSIVLDGFDYWRELDTCCSEEVKSLVRKIGCKLVVRPDSGNPIEMIPKTMVLLDAAYGHSVNLKGYRTLNDVGIIWGDGIDHAVACQLFTNIVLDGYAPENLVLGSGGALLQKVNRDTYRFAQKTSAIKLSDNSWIGVSKNPVTDTKKKSKEGRQTSLNMVCLYEGCIAEHRFSSLNEIRWRARTNANPNRA